MSARGGSKLSIRIKRTAFLLILILTASTSFLLTHYWAKERTNLGFLVKDGNDYVVAWKVPLENQIQYRQEKFSSLNKALHFAKDSLLLDTGRNPISELEIEHLWVQDRFGMYQLLWKTNLAPILHRLSFSNSEEAKYFAAAFRRGSYSPSPFGHSILLLPR